MKIWSVIYRTKAPSFRCFTCNLQPFFSYNNLWNPARIYNGCRLRTRRLKLGLDVTISKETNKQKSKIKKVFWMGYESKYFSKFIKFRGCLKSLPPLTSINPTGTTQVFLTYLHLYFIYLFIFEGDKTPETIRGKNIFYWCK